MSSPLVVLPSELVEHVSMYLTVGDVSSLRLTCREMEAKAQGCFKPFLHRKRIELTAANLKKLMAATEKLPHSISLLQDVTITGLIPLRPVPGVVFPDMWTYVDFEDELEALSHLLSEAFRNLKKLLSEKGGLLTLRLELAWPDTVIEARNELSLDFWLHINVGSTALACARVRETAARTFTIAMGALERSLLPVREHLDIFGGAKGYALACDVFMDRMNREVQAWSQIFGSLKMMTLSLSMPHSGEIVGQGYLNVYEIQGQNLSYAEAKAAGHIDRAHLQQRGYSQPTLRRILELSNNWAQLEGLDLRWYSPVMTPLLSADAPDLGTPMHEESNTGLITAKNLKKCTLRGFNMAEEDVSDFLDRIVTNQLTLTDIHLLSGTWAPIFARMTHPDGPITTYSLEGLFQDYGLVQFDDVPGRWEVEVPCPSSRPDLSPEHPFGPSSSCDRQEKARIDHARLPLSYRLLRHEGNLGQVLYLLRSEKDNDVGWDLG